MSVETKVRIRNYSEGVELHSADDTFLRRDYDRVQEFPSLSLASEVKTEIRTMPFTGIEYLYIVRTGDAATISLYRALSPEAWEFDDCTLLIGVGNATGISLKASADTTVRILVAGS